MMTLFMRRRSQYIRENRFQKVKLLVALNGIHEIKKIKVNFKRITTYKNVNLFESLQYLNLQFNKIPKIIEFDRMN